MYLVLLLSKNHRKDLVCVSLDAVRDMNVCVCGRCKHTSMGIRHSGADGVHVRTASASVPSSSSSSSSSPASFPPCLSLWRKARHEQGLRQLWLPRAPPIRLRKVNPLASPLMRLWPLLLLSRNVELVKVVCCRATGDRDDETRDRAMHASCARIHGYERLRGGREGGRVI